MSGVFVFVCVCVCVLKRVMSVVLRAGVACVVLDWTVFLDVYMYCRIPRRQFARFGFVPTDFGDSRLAVAVLHFRTPRLPSPLVLVRQGTRRGGARCEQSSNERIDR